MDKRTVRAERSKAALKNAFIDLLRTEEPEQITVVKLCKKAELNRSTFYAHYDYIDMMIQEILLENLKDVYANIESQWFLPLENGGVDRAVIKEYLDRFLKNAVLWRFCTCENNAKYTTLIIQLQVGLTVGPTNDPARYYYAFFHNAGVLNLVLEWLSNGKPVPMESIEEIIHEYSTILYKA